MRTLAFLFASVVSMATTAINVQATSDRALIIVHTTAAGTCTYRVSEGATFTANVDDVNPALFAGSAQDSRVGAIVNGRDHYMPIGNNPPTMDGNGKHRLRTLRAHTQHWIGVTCGSDAEISMTFFTSKGTVINGDSRVTVKLSGVSDDALRIAFGYDLEGNLYCTNVAEVCYTSADATEPNSFSYASAAPSYRLCFPICSISIPAPPGRVLYYQVHRKRGNVESIGPTIITLP